MTLHISENKLYLDKSNISSNWQRKNIYRVGLEAISRLQFVASLNLQNKSICHPNIQ